MSFITTHLPVNQKRKQWRIVGIVRLAFFLDAMKTVPDNDPFCQGTREWFPEFGYCLDNPLALDHQL